MRRLYALAGPALALLLAFPLSAQAESAFDGSYFGVRAGYQFGEVDYDDSEGTDSLDGMNLQGATAGLYGGYGRSFDRLYLGGELEASGNRMDGQRSGTDEDGNRLKVEWDSRYTLGGALRGGYLVTPELMVYGRAGLVWTDFEAQSYVNGESTGSDGDHLRGLRFGGGLEYAVSQDILLRAEYTYTHYETYSYSEDGDTLRIQPSENGVNLGIAFRF